MDAMGEEVLRSIFGGVAMFGDQAVIEVDGATGLKIDWIFPKNNIAAIFRHCVEGFRVIDHFFDHTGEVTGVFWLGELSRDSLAHELGDAADSE